MKKHMEKAGLGDFKFEILQENLEIGLPSEEVCQVQCFIARAARPLS